MSTKIYDAWACPVGMSMQDAIALAKETAAIHKESSKQEIVKLYEDLNWMPWYDFIVEAFSGDEETAGRITAAAIYPILKSHVLDGINCFPSSCEDELRHTVVKQASKLSFANRGETIDAFCDFCKDLYVEFIKRHSSLMFFTDNGGRIYVKGFMLTAKSIAYLSSKLETFEFTDATEMEERDFPSLTSDFKACKDNDQRCELLAKAQKEREEKWDELLCGQSSFNGLGLSYSMDDMSRTAKFRDIMEVVKNIIDIHTKHD